MPVGSVRILDASHGEAVEALVRMCADPEPSVRIAYALHVGGLNLLVGRHPGYVSGLNSADIVYADGASVVQLARLAGAQRVERASTTDIGILVLRGLADTLGRPPRVALIGGPAGLAETAGRALEMAAGAQIVYVTGGFRHDDDAVGEELREARPDVLFVGMGVPTEVEWSQRMIDRLPPTAVLTCGGWFGFLAGEEQRAPAIVQRLNLEWAHRLVLSPRRLLPRYARGAASTLRLVIPQLAARRAERDTRATA